MLVIRDALIANGLGNYYSDIEYNRNFDGQIKTIIDGNMEITNITCDLIIHSRGLISEQDNLIAIEMKREKHPESEKNKDRIRLKSLTKPANDSMIYSADGRTFPKHVCGYILGVFYEISIDRRQINIEYYRDGELYSSYVKEF
jgi:hypothetical protein